MSGNRNDMAWKVLKRDIVFQDTWVQLEASRCELPDGRIIEPFYIRRDPDFAVVVAVADIKASEKATETIVPEVAIAAE